jgi:DNA-binding MarR family transcriptional regulator
VTAADTNAGAGNAIGEEPASADPGLLRIDVTCRRAADGRRAIRALGEWSRRFELSEPEFQVLWCLRSVSADGCDQTTIARQLSCSPAQISATVERMRAEGWLTQQGACGDRRRRLWQLSALGRERLADMLLAADQLRYPVPSAEVWDCGPDRPKEAA